MTTRRLRQDKFAGLGIILEEPELDSTRVRNLVVSARHQINESHHASADPLLDHLPEKVDHHMRRFTPGKRHP